MKILKKLRELAGGDTVLDMFIANYVYEKEGVRHKKIMRYSSLPQDKIFTWNEAGRFHKGQYILMHSVIYRTQLLRECGLEQQIKVNKIMIDEFDLWKIPNPKLRHYMFNYLEIITVISTIMLIRSGTEENLEKKRELWKYIKDHDIRLFHHLRNGIMGNALNLPGRGGRKISVAAYKLSQKIVGFN